ncbi:hypothetical protein V2J09_019991 [Rumex salicifolius]
MDAGNETFERLASFSLLANFMVYLKREYGMDQVSASNLIFIWSAVSNFAPVLGAFFSDACFGRFPVIAFSSFAGFLGMVVLTLTAWIPNLRPNKCSGPAQCTTGPNTAQLGVLIASLVLLSIATGGIRPCSIPFGVDQFDFTTEEGRKGIGSYYNWYYTTFTVVVMLALTVMVYVQENLSWVIGFGIPTGLMLASIVLFFLGTRLYVYVKPEGSIFSGVAQAFVAAYRKRRLRIPDGEKVGVYHDPPLQGIVVSKLPLTNEFRFLNKAAIVEEGDLNSKGECTNKWRVSSVQQIEEVKCLIRVLPVWASGIICFTAATQQFTYMVSQALAMDRHISRKSSFQIPAGSMAVVSMLAIAPQLILMGLAEGFNFIAQIEFYNKQFPENMRSIATSLFFCTIAGSSYLSSLITTLVHSLTGRAGHYNWLDDQLNRAHLDYFYLLLAFLGALNFLYFLVVSLRYRYKSIVFEDAAHDDLEHSSGKL